MTKMVPLYRGTSGLNTKVDPARLRMDPKTGMCELAEAVNVDIDQTGRISRRKGFGLLRSGASHSLWADEDLCFFVSGATLYQLSTDYTATQITAGLTSGARMSYARVVDTVYYANGYQCGRIDDGVRSAWSGTAISDAESEVMGFAWDIATTPPIGTMLAVMGGYMLIVEGSTLWWSMEFAHSWFRKSRDFIQFPTDITMLQVLDDGVWISDSRNTYWLSGVNPQEWGLVAKASYSAIIGTDTLINGTLVGEGNIPGRCAIWTSAKGVCLGGPGGMFLNLTERKLAPLDSSEGAGFVIDDRYVVTLSA